MQARLLVALAMLTAGLSPPVSAAGTPALQGLCVASEPLPAFADGAAFRVLLTRMAGPAESVRTAKEQWLPGEQQRVRLVGMAASTILRGSARGLPGHEALAWVRTGCFVQGPGAAEALGRAVGADVVVWGQAECAAGDPHDLACARGGSPGDIRAGLTVLAELPQARPADTGWRPASLPHPVNWGLPVRDVDGGAALLQLVQGLERLQAGAPQSAAHLFQQAGPRAAGLQVEALLLAGDITTAREVAEDELSRSRAVGGERLARALVSHAGVSWFRERQPLARKDLAEAVEVASAAGARHVAAYATLQLALLDERVGDLAGAEHAYASLVAHTFASHDRALRAEVQAGLARTRQAQGRLDEAHAAWLLALPAWQDGSDPRALATVLDGLARTGGRFELARRAQWLERALGLWRDLGEAQRALDASLGLVALAAQSDRAVREQRDAWTARLTRAQATGRAAVVVLESTGDRERVGAVQRDLARIAMYLGDVPAALAWLSASGAEPGERADVERGLAEVLRGQHDGPGALALYEDALAHAAEAGLLREQARVAERIADLQRKVVRDVHQAHVWSERSLVLHQEALAADQPPADASGWARVGDVAMFIDDGEQALAAYLAAEAADLETAARPDPQLPCKAGRALYSLGRFDEAVLAYERGVRVAVARGSTGLAQSCDAGAVRAREAARSVD